MVETPRNSDVTDTDTQSNATATATIAAPSDGQSVNVTMVSGGFDGASTISGKTLILKEGSTEKLRWYVYDSKEIVFDSPIRINGAANLELEAGGSAGNGTASIAGYTV